MQVIDIHPLGFHIKVAVVEIERKSKAGVILSSEREFEREQDGVDVGKVLELGPTVYNGFSGCDSKNNTENADKWGIKVGDIVEFNRYDGKKTRASEYNKELKKIRTINDSQLINRWEVTYDDANQ